MRELGSQTMHNIGEESRWTSLLLCRAMVGWEIRWACQEIALRPITLTLMGMGRHLSTAFYGSWDIYSYLSVPKVNWPMMGNTRYYQTKRLRGFTSESFANVLFLWMKVINIFFLGIYSKVSTWYLTVILFNKLIFFLSSSIFLYSLHPTLKREKYNISLCVCPYIVARGWGIFWSDAFLTECTTRSIE